MIKLKDFVDVNLHSVNPTSSEANKTVVYMYGNTSSSVDEYITASNVNTKKTLFDEDAQAFIQQFFNLGGRRLRAIQIQTGQARTLDTVKANNQLFLDKVKALPMAQVAVVIRQADAVVPNAESFDATGYHYETFSPTSGEIDGNNTLLATINALVEEKGTAYRKLVARYYYQATYVTTDLQNNLTRNENLIWKLCNDEKDLAGILAYLSKVTTDNPDTLKDYCFTVELTATDMSENLLGVDWADIKNFVNVDVDLEDNDTVINIGGNTSAGFDIIQEFESIYISQQLLNKELSLLKNKISLTDARSVIHSAIIDVLEAYYQIGYLVQDTYNKANIYRNINGKNVCILAKGEVISGGYKIIILPKKTGEDIHNFPEIEIIINTNKGIRYIKTTGVVL